MLYDVQVPPNTTATLFLHQESHQSFTENGKPIAKARGVHKAGQSGARVILELQPGQYLIEAR
jgi:hypothetical protein